MPAYSVTASRTTEHASEARARSVVIPLDTSCVVRADTVCAVELLLAAIGASVLAAAEHAAEAMSFALAGASVVVRGCDSSNPARALTFAYDLTVGTDEPEHRLLQLHERVWQRVHVLPFARTPAHLSGRIRRRVE
jgi:uncharacterized OsmC-like protein